MERNHPDHRNPSGRGQGAIAPGFSPGRYPIVLLIGLGSSIVWLIFISQEGRSSLARWMALRSDHVSLQGIVLHPFFHYAGRGSSRDPEPDASGLRSDRVSTEPVVENVPAQSPVPRPIVDEDLLAVLHVGVCLLALVYAGRTLEARWGAKRFGAFFAFVTLGAAGVSLGVAALRQSPSVVFGTGAAALACLAVSSTLGENTVVMRIFRRRHLAWAGVFVIAAGMILLGRARSPIGAVDILVLPQISGIAFGLVFSALLPVYDRAHLDRELQRRREQEQRIQEVRTRVDGLLKKISSEGYGSLTSEEKAFLEDASQHYQRRV
jgi:hypothetical protein